MRYRGSGGRSPGEHAGAVRALAGGVLVLCAAGALTGCGLGSGDNSEQVCADTKKTFQQYITQVRTVSAAEPTQWKQATDQLAGRVDALAAKAEDGKLKKALKEEAGRLRTAAGNLGTGDVAQLNAVITDTPQRIGKACP